MERDIRRDLQLETERNFLGKDWMPENQPKPEEPKTETLPTERPPMGEVIARKSRERLRLRDEAERLVQAWFDTGRQPAEYEQNLKAEIDKFEQIYENIEQGEKETREAVNRRSENALKELQAKEMELKVLQERLAERQQETEPEKLPEKAIESVSTRPIVREGRGVPSPMPVETMDMAMWGEDDDAEPETANTTEMTKVTPVAKVAPATSRDAVPVMKPTVAKPAASARGWFGGLLDKAKALFDYYSPPDPKPLSESTRKEVRSAIQAARRAGRTDEGFSQSVYNERAATYKQNKMARESAEQRERERREQKAKDAMKQYRETFENRQKAQDTYTLPEAANTAPKDRQLSQDDEENAAK